MDERIRACMDKLKTYPEIVVAYWFGSRAQGKGTPLSDWDFALKFKPQADWRCERHVRAVLSDILGTDAVDLVNWDLAPLKVRYAIVQQGVLLLSRNEEVRVEMEITTRSRYWDFEPYIREYQEAFFRKLMERGGFLGQS